MIQLKEPAIDNESVYDAITRRKTFKNLHCAKCKIARTECSSCNRGNRGKMQNLRRDVFQRYQFYFQNKNSLNEIVPINMMSSDELELFSDSYKNSVEFQKVKKELLENIPAERRGLCPFCMISEPTTMEHYFPESDYPEYILFAPNLVPCCSYCNSKKGNRLFIYANNWKRRLILHFYYDKIPQTQYLKAVFCVENKIPHITFFLEFEEESEMTEIIKYHFSTLNLLERYESRCEGILSTTCISMKELLNNGGTIEQCIQLLQIKEKALKKVNGNNYWEACIYEAMSRSKKQLVKMM